MFTRRQFLTGLSTTFLASLYDPQRLFALDAWSTIPKFNRVGNGRKVVIVGAGITGLSAALHLAEAGFDPIILERTSRHGGRFLTLRKYFGSQYAELGVTRIPDNHHLPLAYAKRFGLTTVSYPYDDTNYLYHLGGTTFSSQSSKQGYPAAFKLHPQEAKLGVETLRHQMIQSLYESIGDVRKKSWPSEDVKKKWDSLTLTESHQKISHASSNAIAISKAYNGSEIQDYSALHWLGAEQLDKNWDRTYAIAGGNDRLTDAFAKRVADRIVYSAKVKTIRNLKSGVSVVYEKGDKTLTLNADFVLCALPTAPLAEIEFQPSLSPIKARAIAEIPMQKVARLNFQFNNRFWNTQHKTRGLLVACSDTKIERLWDLTATQAGTEGILTAYVQYKNAAEIGALGDMKSKIDFGLTQMESFFPEARKHFKKGLVWEWHEQPWVQGAWAFFKPGQIDLFQALQKPEGRIHFAGDHTSLYNGWAQGALESAHQACAEIINA